MRGHQIISDDDEAMEVNVDESAAFPTPPQQG